MTLVIYPLISHKPQSLLSFSTSRKQKLSMVVSTDRCRSSFYTSSYSFVLSGLCSDLYISDLNYMFGGLLFSLD